ncbi:MAG: T9SS type A sorting domain-containing protein [Melioribacteraceae bacterium]|nr:T9SS type A sorting domain-containing protein [Melioribacteraceae bacterium]
MVISVDNDVVSPYDLCDNIEEYLPGYVTVNLTNGTHEVNFKLMSIDPQTLNCYDFIVWDSQTYTVEVKFKIRIQNNFGGGNISVDGLTKSSPYDRTSTTGDNIGLGAIEQTDGSYNYIWNTNGTNNSNWTYKLESQGFNLFSSSQNTSYNVSSNDRNTIIQANLRKICNVSFSNQFIGSSYGGQVKVNGVWQSAPTSSIQVVEQNNITAEAQQTYQINGILHTFSQWSNSSTSLSTSFNISQHSNVSADYSAKPMFSDNDYRGLTITASSDPEEFIQLNWNDHPNTSVTSYLITRKRGYLSPVTIGTVSRGTTQFIDYEYSLTGGGLKTSLEYSVQAYYSPAGTYSDIDYNFAIGYEADPFMKEKVENTDNTSLIVSEYSISNFPNPFNPATQRHYQLPEQGHVTIKVYDMLGKEVAELVNETKDMGVYNVSFSGDNLASGVYVYTIKVDALSKENRGFTASKKMLLMK